MDEQKLQEVKSKIMSAVQCVRDRGLKVVAEGWWRTHSPISSDINLPPDLILDGCCPISAVWLCNTDNPGKVMDFVQHIHVEEAAAILGVEKRLMTAFYRGFDDGALYLEPFDVSHTAPDCQEGYKLGWDLYHEVMK